MAQRIQAAVYVGPPKRRVHVVDERRWLDGPFEGLWWHWILPGLATILLVIVIYPWWRPNLVTVIPEPKQTPIAKIDPSPSITTVPKTVVVSTSPVSIDLSPVERGLEKIADRIQVQAPIPVPQQVTVPVSDVDSAAERARRLEEWSHQP